MRNYQAAKNFKEEDIQCFSYKSFDSWKSIAANFERFENVSIVLILINIKR